MTHGRSWDDAKVGALVLAALATLVAGSLWLASGPFPGAEREDYVVAIGDSGGLNTGDAVRVAGMRVGRVTGVRLESADPRPIRLEISVRDVVELYADAHARVSTAGVFGDPYLSIDPGTASAGPLKPGGTIEGVATAGIEQALARLDEIGEKMGVLLDKATALVARVDGEMTPLLGRIDSLLAENNLDAIEATLAEMRTVAEEAGPKVGPLLDRIDSLAASAGESLDSIPDVAEDLRELFADMRSALGEDGERLRRLLETTESSLASTGETMTVIADNRLAIEAALGDLRATLANLEEFSRTIKERPYSLVRIKPEPDRKPGDSR